jgi:mono/diheme cytochrome c family protein
MKRPLFNTFSAITVAIAFASCGVDTNSPGVEYMPDMYRSPALEAYVDYGSNKHMDWTQSQKDEAGVQAVLSRAPAKGSIAYAGDDALFGMPYALPNDTTGYSRSAREIHSPLLASKVNIEEGKRLYMIFCQHCHGKEGHGDGAISKNGLIAGIPDYATKLKDLEEGKMYHTLQYGKGLMGSHASQLNQKERWQILEWVKCLQQGIATPEFDAKGMLKVASAEAAADSTK